ncbi:MAG TPA: NAD(P)H-dependent glycerol-3-phosphate dehydrogenase [Rhodocyclaceae bacterium]
MTIAVLGAGAWGTALAIAWAADRPVRLWSREQDHVAAMLAAGENAAFLPGYRLPDALIPTGDFTAAVSGADIAVIATPVAGLRETAAALCERRFAGRLVWVCKGFETGSGLLPHAVVAEAFPGAAGGALSGPSFAQEVADGRPTAVTLAAPDLADAEALARELHTGSFRVYAHDDLPGTEIGGAIKNVLAIATGICDGLGLGYNARAALITRGLAEIARLGAALGGRRETFMGLAGVGDLILTCTGDLSRNRRVGLELAQGKTLDEILVSLGHVAEGVNTAREVARLATARQIDMPIARAVAAVLDGKLAAKAAVGELLARAPTVEFR